MNRQIRVLHVVNRLDRAGAETWLMHVLRSVDRQELAMDFLAHDPNPGAYDAEAVGRGARVFVCPGHRNLLRQLIGMRRLQRREGPFDIVHSHADYYGGFVALLATLVGIRVRVVSFHRDAAGSEDRGGVRRRLYVAVMRLLVKWFATGGLGTSAAAASALFGRGWRGDSRWRVHHACVDLGAFSRPQGRDAVRESLRIPPGSLVIGHVGRFVTEKNHEFFVRVARVLAMRDARFRFLLVGGGPLRDGTERLVDSEGLRGRFVLLQPRGDVPGLLGAMDGFLFPSRCEGLGLALVEAQAAGLRCFASSAVPDDAIAVPKLVRRLPLQSGPEYWAGVIQEGLGGPSPVTQVDALQAVARKFDIARNVAELLFFYREAVG